MERFDLFGKTPDRKIELVNTVGNPEDAMGNFDDFDLLTEGAKISCNLEDKWGGLAVKIRSLYVEDVYRKRGLARLLLQETLFLCAENQVDSVYGSIGVPPRLPQTARPIGLDSIQLFYDRLGLETNASRFYIKNLSEFIKARALSISGEINSSESAS